MDVKRGLRNSILLPSLIIWVGEVDKEYSSAVKSMCCRDELSERSVWSGWMGWAEQRECVQAMWHDRLWKWGVVWWNG